MARGTRIFWWAPARQARLARPEVRYRASAWLRLAVETGRRFTNFGDEFTKDVWPWVTGRDAIWSPVDRADVVAVGSVLELAIASRSRAALWGTGARGGLCPAQRGHIEDHMSLVAVRGPRTREVTGAPQTIPLGDPGILVSDMWPMPHQRRAGMILVPHFRTWASKADRGMLQVLARQGVRIVNPTLPPREVAAAVRGSDLVLSSSLHGIIFAHAYGVPVQPVALAAGEPSFKYVDHFSTIGLTPEFITLRDCLDPLTRKGAQAAADGLVSDVRSRIDALIPPLLHAGKAFA